MPASRALPEPGEPLTTVLEARAARRRGAGEARRSEAKRAAEDGRIGDTARSGERHSMERRTTLADARRPPASARPSAGGGGSCARRAWPSLLRMRLLQPWFNLSGEGVGDAVCGPRAFSEFTGVPLGLGDQVPDAATPLKIRRGARSRMPRSPRRRAPQETRRAGEIRRPARPGRGGTGTPATRPLSAWTPEAARCTRSGLPPPTSTTSSSPAPSCGRTARFATPARDTRARATRPGLPAASPA